MKEKYIHAANFAGLWDLVHGDDTGMKNFLCCSSMDCDGYLKRDILLVVTGTEIARYGSDVASDREGRCLGDGYGNTEWDEIHIQDFEIEAIRCDSEDMVEQAAHAYYLVTYIWEELPNFRIEGACAEQAMQAVDALNEEVQNMTEDEYEDYWEAWQE